MILGARTAEATSTLTLGVAQSSRLEKSYGKRSFEMASRPSLFCDSSGRVSDLPVVGSLNVVNM
jgi:hypothetical protein